MSKRTMLLIASWVELMLAAYFGLAFIAWSLRLFLFPTHPHPKAWLLLVPVLLAGACFVLYPRTRRKMDDVE